jgi:AAA15 family ATPase/GTPase
VIFSHKIKINENIGGQTMLIRFNIKNFLSFSARENDQSQEFSMIAGKVRSKKEHLYDDSRLKLLKFAAVYGANASGKSNLVKAIDFMKRTILTGLPKGHTVQYCKVDPLNRTKESYFELELLLNDRYYAYGFEVILHSSQFVSEWLVELTPDGNEKIVFTRNIKDGDFEPGKIFKDRQFKEKLNLYADDIRNDESALLLTVMNQHKKNLYTEHQEAQLFKQIYEWFADCLDITYPDNPLSSYSYMANQANIDEVCRMIAAFGTGITSYEVIEVPIEKIISKLPKLIVEDLTDRLQKSSAGANPAAPEKNYSLIMRSKTDFFMIENDPDGNLIGKTIQFSHGEKNVLFNLNEESDGTIRILDLIEVLINPTGNKVYLIDELDRCLHPSLSYKFVETFLQFARNRNIQLIVTTHESRLMDFDLLRRDEIWFVNKNQSGQSDIYSLEEYNSRFDQKIDKAYLEGRYRGVPIFSTVFPIDEV